MIERDKEVRDDRLSQYTRFTNKEKVLKYLIDWDVQNPGDWVSKDSLAWGLDINITNISKYIQPLVKEGKIEKEYQQIGRARYLNVRYTNSISEVKKTEKNGIFKKAFQEVFKILKEFKDSPYISFIEGKEALFSPEIQQYWIDIVSRRNLGIIDKAEEGLKNE